MQVTERLVFRNGGMADLPEVRRILTAANETYRAALAPQAFAAYLKMVLDLEGRIGVAEVIVAERDGHAVGTVTYFPDAVAEGWGCPDGHAGIRSMAVDPTMQGRGVGAALLDECRRRAIVNDVDGIILHTAHFLPDAIRLYEHHGFVRDPRYDLRAKDVMELDDRALDYQALAYRLELPR